MAEQCVVGQIARLVDARLAGAAGASAVAGIIEHEERGAGGPELPDDRPDGGNGLTISIRPQNGGEGAARGGKYHPTSFVPSCIVNSTCSPEPSVFTGSGNAARGAGNVIFSCSVQSTTHRTM